MSEPVSYTSTHHAEFGDGSRVQTVVTYWPPPTDSAPLAAGRAALAPGRLVGVHDERPPTVVTQVFPGARMTREFIAGVQPYPPKTPLSVKANQACRASWNANLVPEYSLKLGRVDVIAGRWDQAIRELARWHLDQPHCELIIHHEPENDRALQGGNFPGYFNRIAQVFRQVNDRIPLVYAAMGYQWLPGRVNGTVKGHTSNPKHWQGVEADLFTIDLYSGNTAPLDTIIPEHKGWQRWMEHVVGTRPWGVSERGFIGTRDHEGRAEAIRREARWLTTDPVGKQCRRYIYWNTAGTERNESIVVDAAGEAAVRDLVAELAG